ncbi:MAG: tyrosine-protein phosphatase [Solirubrobacterales bacterium]|nr:tyrosine-protein phosphatase [Solirubrobacterales bacterium]HMT04515.1 tyrosine-protein phosphatase [Solirubrobacterales bacterium]
MNSKAMEPGQNIPVETLPNLRDIGGYRAAEGKSVKRGQLYRSVLLARLGDADLRKVEELGLKTVFDLRTAAEAEASPDREIGAREVKLDVLADRTGESANSLLAQMENPDAIGSALSNGQGAEMMKEAYRELVELPSAISSYRTFFTDLAAMGTVPALFHCTTGKDRTGWAAASTLLFLGVEEEDVFHDYLLTNQQLLPALKPIFDQFASAGGDPAVLKPVLCVEREYLQTAIDLMKSRYGSIDGYMREGLSLDGEVLESLRARLLVGQPTA